MPFPQQWISGEKITALKLNAWNDALACFEQVSSTAAAALRQHVGFGTSSPQHPVHVNTGEAWKGFRADRNGAPFFAAYSDAAGHGEMVLSTAGGQNNVVLRASGASVLNGGNVGIGTASPEAGLHLQGRRLLVHYDDWGNWAIRLRGQKEVQNNWGEYDIVPNYLGVEIRNSLTGGRMLLADRQGDAYPGRALVCEAQTNTPPNPAVGYARIYLRNNRLIIQFNDAGTIRYKWLDLAGAGVTWQHSTTAP